MNDELLFEAMSGLDDAYIVSAARSLGYYGLDSVPARRPRRALRRTVTAIAAAVMLMLAGCLTAMAVSEPVREAVLAFFGVQSEETVPVQDGAQAAMPVRNGGETLSGGIEAAYYSVPNNCEAGGGIFLTGDDAWVESGSEFIQLEEEYFADRITIQGKSIYVNFNYAVYNGVCAVTWYDLRVTLLGGSYLTAEYRPMYVCGNPEAMLFILNMDGRDYPVLIDVTTGEYTDLLEGTDIEATYRLDNGYISADGSELLLPLSGAVYYINTRSGTFLSLDELSGERVDNCSLLPGGAACWSYGPGEDGLEAAHGWYVDFATGERTELFGNTPTSYQDWDGIALCGALYGYENTPGAAFALLVGKDGAVEVLDFKTGAIAPVNGLVWPKSENSRAIVSPDGKEMLIDGWGYAYRHESLTVLDSETRQYHTLQRENNNSVEENRVWWYDENSVAMLAYKDNPQTGMYGPAETYFYIYDFSSAIPNNTA